MEYRFGRVMLPYETYITCEYFPTPSKSQSSKSFRVVIYKNLDEATQAVESPAYREYDSAKMKFTLSVTLEGFL